MSTSTNQPPMYFGPSGGLNTGSFDFSSSFQIPGVTMTQPSASTATNKPTDNVASGKMKEAETYEATIYRVIWKTVVDRTADTKPLPGQYDNVWEANGNAAQALLNHVKPKTAGGHEIDQYHNEIVPKVTEKRDADEPFNLTLKRRLENPNRPLDGSYMEWIDESQITVTVIEISYKPDGFLLRRIAELESDNQPIATLKRERDDLVETRREHTQVLEDAQRRVKHLFPGQVIDTRDVIELLVDRVVRIDESVTGVVKRAAEFMDTGDMNPNNCIEKLLATLSEAHQIMFAATVRMTPFFGNQEIDIKNFSTFIDQLINAAQHNNNADVSETTGQAPDEKCDRLAAQCRDVEAKLAAKETELTKLQSEKSAAETEFFNTAIQLAAKQTEFTALEGNYTNATTQLAAQQTQIENLTAQKNTAEGNFDTIVNNIKLVLGSVITDTQSFFPSQELTLDNCIPLLAAKVKSDAAAGSIDKKGNKDADHSEALKDLKVQYQNNLDYMNGRISELEREEKKIQANHLQEVKELKANFKKTLSAKEAKIADLESKSKIDGNGSLAVREKTFSEIHLELIEKESEVDELRVKCGTYREEVGNLLMQVKTLEKDNLESSRVLSHQLAITRYDVGTFRKNLKQANETIAALQTEKDVQIQRNINLQDQKEVLLGKIHQLQDLNDDIRHELDQSHHDRCLAAREAARQRSEIKLITSAREKAQNERYHLIDVIQDARHEAREAEREYKSEIKLITSARDQLQSELISEIKLIAAARDEVQSELKSEITLITSARDEVQSELDNLTDIIQDVEPQRLTYKPRRSAARLRDWKVKKGIPVDEEGQDSLPPSSASTEQSQSLDECPPPPPPPPSEISLKPRNWCSWLGLLLGVIIVFLLCGFATISAYRGPVGSARNHFNESSIATFVPQPVSRIEPANFYNETIVPQSLVYHETLELWLLEETILPPSISNAPPSLPMGNDSFEVKQPAWAGWKTTASLSFFSGLFGGYRACLMAQ